MEQEDTGIAISECISTPLAVIDKLVENKLDGTSIENLDTESLSTAVEDHFKTIFSNTASLDKIPVYSNSTTQLPNRVPKERTLVRFRCMVQDPGYSEELHLSVFQIRHETSGESKYKVLKYTDSPLGDGWEVNTGEPNNKFSERTVAYCVDVPGTSVWAKPGYGEQREALEDAFEAMRVDGGDMMTERNRFPLDGEPHSAALVKFYAPAKVPKVSSIVDIVGIYEPGYNSRTEDEGVWPCIHAIFHIEDPHEIPISEPGMYGLEVFSERRALCLDYFGAMFGGFDDLAAEFLLLHVVSSTVDVQGTKVGKFSLNLIGVPDPSNKKSDGFRVSQDGAVSRIADGLGQVIPRTVEIPFDLNLLNKNSFMPNAETGGLSAGVLQLPKNTEIICDETCLGEGTLEESGIRNLHALQGVILDQSLTFTYPFQQIEMPTDLRVLVISAGKSILQNDCDLYLSSEARTWFSETGNGEASKVFDPLHIELIREYIEQARRVKFSVPLDVSDAISQEYAEERRKAHENGSNLMTQGELSYVLNVARLISISKGEGELNMETWEYAKRLVEAQKTRNDDMRVNSRSGPVSAAKGVSAAEKSLPVSDEPAR